MAQPENIVSEEAHGWLYDAISAKGGQDLVASNNQPEGSRIGFTLNGVAYLARLEAVPEETA